MSEFHWMLRDSTIRRVPDVTSRDSCSNVRRRWRRGGLGVWSMSPELHHIYPLFGDEWRSLDAMEEEALDSVCASELRLG